MGSDGGGEAVHRRGRGRRGDRVEPFREEGRDDTGQHVARARGRE